MNIGFLLQVKKPLLTLITTAVSFISLIGILQSPSYIIVWLLLWLIVLIGIFVVVRSFDAWRMNILPVALMTICATTGFVSVLEHETTIQMTTILSSLAIGALYGWGLSTVEDTLGFKPYRRFVMMLSVFDIYASMTFLFAISAFFAQELFFFLAVILGGVVYAAGAYYIWRLYIASTRTAGVWAMLLGLMSMQLIWVIHLLPFSYGVLGLLTTWIWYLMQLFIRFHVSKKGIIWKKQAIFLGSNFVLMILVLFFFVRWV